MACGGLKYNGIIFGNKRDLMDYLLTGKKPESNITIQEIENDIIKNALNNNDVPTAINDIINVAKIPDNQRSLLNDTFGVDIAQAFVQYVETGNIPSANKNTIRPIFQEILTNINDIVSSVEYSNKQVGSKPIEISTQVLEFTNKIKNNDSQRFIPTGSRSESNGITGFLPMEKEKWFNPREEGPQGATGEVQAVSERRTTDADNQARGNINRRAGIIGDVKDSSDSEINTTKYSGIPIDGYPERIQLNTGEFISWDADTREWSNVVRNVSGDRWGKLRTASQRERDAAATARESRIITTESSNDTAVNMIFGQGDPMSNLSTLNNAGYIDLNPTELYNKLKPQFDNNGINLDQISNVIGTDLYPSLFSIVGENAINNMDNKIVLENLNNAGEEYPSNINNPEKLFSNTGFAPAQTELLTFIHGLIPEAYNKTNTSIEIAIELMYPEQTGFNIMNTLPYTKEEMYDIMTKYENKNIEQNLGSIFIHEYINNDMSFGMKRNKEILDSIINKAKSLQIELPQQYENYFQATTKIKTFFKKGQKLRNKEEILYVHDINYSNPEDITYILWHPQEDAYYEMGLLNMDVFSEDTESDYSKLEDAAINVINALEETGTMVRFVPKLKKPGHFNIFNNEIYLDVRKLSNRLLYHEAAHAAFIKGVRADKETIIKMHTEISNVLRNGTPEERSLSEKLDSFIDRYTETEAEAAKMPLDELRAHEFMAELVAQLSENKSKITKKSEKSIIDKIIEFFRNVLGYNQNLDINNIDDLIDMINGISNKLLTGEKINFSDYNNSISDNNLNKGVLYGLGDIYEGSKAKFFTPGKKIGITMPDGKTSSVIVGLSGTNNNGDGFTELKFPDGKIQRYKTEHLVLREGFGDLFISLMPAADQKANEVHKGNILSNDDKQMLKDFALEKNQAGDYEFSLKDIHSLIKDDVEVDYNVFVDLINSFREEQALKEAKNTDPIGDDAYSDFINNNSVSNDILNSIATKIATRKNLSNREKAIYAARSTEIETIILDYVDQPQPNEPVPPKRSGEAKILQSVISVMNSFNVSPEMAEILMKGKDPGDVIKFKSGETIERKSGEAPENSQLAIRFEFGKASEIARGELAKLKDFYGKDVFEKTIDLLLTNQIGQVGTQLMRIVMNQDLDLTLANDESSRPLVKAMKRSLYRFVQASAREASITLGLSRQLSMTPENMFKSSSVAIDTVLTPESKEARQEILDALEKQELDEDYLDYTARRDQATKSITKYSDRKTSTSNTKKRSDKSEWVPKGKGFLDSAIKTVKDFINKNC